MYATEKENTFPKNYDDCNLVDVDRHVGIINFWCGCFTGHHVIDYDISNGILAVSQLISRFYYSLLSLCL